MEIPHEGIILGSDDDCELIVFDSKIAPHHLRLIPQEDGFLFLSPLEGEVFVNGALVEGDVIIESPAQVITAGDTHLVAGRADQEWPEAVVPDDSTVPSSAEEIPVNFTSPTPPPPDKEKKKIFSRILILSGVMTLIGLGTYFAYEEFSKKRKRPAPFAPIAQSARLFHKFSNFWEQILPKKPPATKALPPPASSLATGKTSLPWPPPSIEVRVMQELLINVPHVVFTINEGEKRKQFEVWVRGEEASTMARRILDRASPPFTYNLIDLSQLELSAATLVRLYGIMLQVRIEPEGIAFWSGYLQDDKNWKTCLPHVFRDLPAIRDSRCEVAFGNRLVALISTDLQQQGFKGDVRPVAGETGLRLEGFLAKEQKQKWDSWIAAIREKYASQASIIDQVNSATTVRRSLKDFFPSQVLGISGNIMPWVSLADGSKLFPGAKLKNGYTLETITSDTLRLKGPEGQIDFSLSSLN